ncbi:DMT family transporter [Jiella marina]|uniref:DMT family transporter n=1 Tax=Jiella sp. LLJ827 TaxID=2917712 RepID=UPI002101B544|nr:DMT family transporter [Jiella sp. LLJ827]MCQ0987102.1 DMT family transporter [Jiella sp. LLJ827]
MRKTTNLGGIVAMLCATGFFVIADTVMKLATEELPPYEVLFLRSVAASLTCAVLVTVRGEWGSISGVFDLNALLRAMGETLCTLCYVLALALLPIADMIAIIQTTPLLVVLGAALLLRERIGATRTSLALVGFSGALLVAQPGATGVNPAILLAFGAATLGAVRDLAGRNVPARIPVSVVNLSTLVILSAAAGAMSLSVETWTPPKIGHVASLGLAGMLVALGHVGLLLAYRLGRPASVAPFFYSFALWGVLAGIVVWGTAPNGPALAGIALICGSGAAIVLLEQGRKREPAALR